MVLNNSAESQKDTIPEDLFSKLFKEHIQNSNKEIKRRFQHAQHYVPRDCFEEDILTIERLIEYNNILFK